MGAFKLGGMTLGSLFKKPETLQYPAQTKEPPAGLKGQIAIDAETCILCGLCARSCPTDSIAVSKPDRTWSIQHFQCIQCGYCTQVCPKKCLTMLPTYPTPATEKHVDVVEIPEQEKKPKAEATAAAEG